MDQNGHIKVGGLGGLGGLPQGSFERHRFYFLQSERLFCTNLRWKYLYLACAKKKNTDDNSKYIKTIMESMLLRVIGHS